ncbi:MAG: metal ABC transporter permease [Chloroflexota bacterium]|nr:metal ABC transporter permease [Chloroflexota bacterium]
MDIGQFLQQLLLDPLTPAFMQRVMVAVLMIGVICGVIGAYVVTRGMAFMGDALAHTILPGVAVAYMASNGNPGWILVGGMIAGVISAVVISLLSRGANLSEDTAIGIVFAGALALGIGIISSQRDYSTDISHLLIGNIFAVGNDDLLLMLGISVAVLIGITLLYKEFLVISFDPTFGETLRLPGRALNTLLLVLLALTVVVALQAVGIALVAALLVIPAATARYFVKRLHHLMGLAALVGAVGGVIGVYLSWHLSIAPSAAIVLTLVAFFLLAFLFAPGNGYFQRGRKPAIARQIAP